MFWKLSICDAGTEWGVLWKLSKCNISHKIVHLGHAFDLVNKFDKFYFQKKCPQYFFSSKNILGNHNVPGQQNTYITIFSDQNAFISSPSYFFYTPIILFYQNLQRFKVYKIICGKATSLSRDNKIMSRDRWNFYFELKVPWNGIDSQNFAQDPAGPIWTALYRYIYPEIYFTTTETHFCQMSRDNKNGEI